MTLIHVIGAGLAGLSAALSLTAKGLSVVLHEAGPAAGGRCRSYYDKELGLRIDNGNHLLLSGNRAAKAYITEIGAERGFLQQAGAAFPFIDVATQERWVVRPNRGPIPWWIFSAQRRVPHTKASDYLGMARIARTRDDISVAESVRCNQLYRRLLEPVAVAALNTAPKEGLARLLGAVMRETLLRGAAACIPMLPEAGLSEALIDPAVATLQARGAEIRLNNRVANLSVADGKIAALQSAGGSIDLDASDWIVLAVPPWIATALLPGLTAPDRFEAILNIHFRIAVDALKSAEPMTFIGLTSGIAEWVFVKPGHVSVTISAANGRVDDPAQVIAAAVWPDVVDALGLPVEHKQTMPAYRVVKEKRATFAATAAQEQRRPHPRSALASNLAIAGDWTATGLPATIEGAIRSGRAAADVVLSI